jgi:uncharacterized protein YjaZ
MSFKLHLLNASGSLGKFQVSIKKNFESALKKLPEEYQKLKVDVIVWDNPYGTIRETGIGGYTPSSNVVFISLDSKLPNLSSSINKEFGGTLIHEIHHVIRWSGPGYGQKLDEAIISEGLADHFELEIYGGSPRPWSVALKGGKIEEYMKKAKKEFGNKNYDHDAWFYGSKEKNIPRWAGYSLGFYLVGKYLKKNPNEKASTLHDIEAKKILDSL